MNKLIPIIIILVLLAAGGAFYGGMKYAQNKVPPRSQQLGAAAAGLRSGRAGGGFAAGEIIAKDDKSITVKLQDGGSRIIFYSATTKIGEFVDGTMDALEIGKAVTINGKANQDGSITAETIQFQLRPTLPARPLGE